MPNNVERLQLILFTVSSHSTNSTNCCKITIIKLFTCPQNLTLTLTSTVIVLKKCVSKPNAFVLYNIAFAHAHTHTRTHMHSQLQLFVSALDIWCVNYMWLDKAIKILWRTTHGASRIYFIWERERRAIILAANNKRTHYIYRKHRECTRNWISGGNK